MADPGVEGQGHPQAMRCRVCGGPRHLLRRSNFWWLICDRCDGKPPDQPNEGQSNG